MRSQGICFAARRGGALGLAGCGTPAGFFPVSGKVLYKGEPAAGAVVYFHREGPTPALVMSTLPVGIAEEDGSFYLDQRRPWETVARPVSMRSWSSGRARARFRSRSRSRPEGKGKPKVKHWSTAEALERG